MERCPACEKESHKVLYLGFPMRLCEDGQECANLFGFWSFIPAIWFNGTFMEYTGSYFSALWSFLFDPIDDMDDEDYN